MVNVKKRKGRVVIDSDSEDSASDDNLDQVCPHTLDTRGVFFLVGCRWLEAELTGASGLRRVWPRWKETVLFTALASPFGSW